MNTDTVLTIGLLVVGYALISGKVERSVVTPAMAFVTVGLIVGPDVLDLVNVRVDEKGFEALAELALTIVLFLQASRLDLRAVFKHRHLPRRLVLVGLPLCMGLGTIAALLVFSELSFWEAAILGIIVAPTEVALIEPVIPDRWVPVSIRQSLSIESGLSDGIALGFLLIALAFASEHTESSAGDGVWFVVRSLVVSLIVGATIGLLGGWLLKSGRKAGWITKTWGELFLIALAALTFVVVEHLHGSGFVGAFGAGLAFALVVPKALEREEGTAEAIGELLELVVFALLGAAAVWPAFEHLDGQVLLFAALTLIVVRMLAVAIAMIRSGFSRATTLYVGWFGPRGLATLLFGFLVLEEGAVAQEELITQTVVVTVTLSIFLHGVTARVGAARYGAATDALRQSRPLAPELEVNGPELEVNREVRG